MLRLPIIRGCRSPKILLLQPTRNPRYASSATRGSSNPPRNTSTTQSAPHCDDARQSQQHSGMPPSPSTSTLSVIMKNVRVLENVRQQLVQSTAWWIGKYVFLFTTLALFCTHRIASSRPVSGPSMLPTINVRGDSVIVCMLYPSILPVRAGDMVSFESPMRSGERAIKRIIGMPGDLVLRDTPPGSSDNFWIEADPDRHLAQNLAGNGDGWMVRVPEGHCWVVGDNLPWSRDSRHFGPLPLALVKGRVIARSSPWRERKWYRRSEAFEDLE